MKEPVDHILRPSLPWRSAGEAAITECGYDAAKVKTLTREEYFQRLKEFGRQRTAMLTCMTCADTATRWRAWDEAPLDALEREIVWERGYSHWSRQQPKRGEQLYDELLAIEALIENHRDEFAAMVRERSGRRAWLEQKASLEARKPLPKTGL